MTMLTPPPWVANEKWDYDILWNGKQIARVTGRQRCPANLLKDWAWLAKNSYEQQVSEAPWFHPEWPAWRRELVWNYYRNPLQNARLFLWGWADRNYTVTVIEGDPDPMTVQRNDKGQKGYQRTLLTAENGETRQFTSYCGDKIVWYWGTQPTGIYGAKFNLG